LWAEKYPVATKEIADNKLFEIGNHSFDHPAFKYPCFNLKKASDKESEIIKTQNAIKKIAGIEPKFFRFPGGCFAKDDADLVHKLGLESIGWDVVSGDSYLKSNEKIVEQAVGETKNGSIIVMHLSGVKNVSNTDVALFSIIKELKNKGYVFVTISQLIKDF
jgi:peptidoglycan/xylan/chitin deacetylase (PgdA/CDA1 family)